MVNRLTAGFTRAAAHIDDLKAILDKHRNKICRNFTFSSITTARFMEILLVLCRQFKECLRCSCAVMKPSNGLRDLRVGRRG